MKAPKEFTCFRFHQVRKVFHPKPNESWFAVLLSNIANVACKIAYSISCAKCL